MSTGAQPRDRLADLADDLMRLDDEPVDDHPAALEAVHRTVVAELEGLAGVGRDRRIQSETP